MLFDQTTQSIENILVADDQPGTECVQIAGEGLEAFAEEMLALGAGPIMLALPLAQEVNRDH